jgi:hypothetical protein
MNSVAQLIWYSCPKASNTGWEFLPNGGPWSRTSKSKSRTKDEGVRHEEK